MILSIFAVRPIYFGYEVHLIPLFGEFVEFFFKKKDNVYVVLFNIYRRIHVCMHICAGVHTHFAILTLITEQLVNKHQVNSKKNYDIFRIE